MDMVLPVQILSSEFLNLTGFFLVNSFWMNFYIGSFDMQLGDKHNLTGEQRHGFAEYFTLAISLGVVAIPLIGALMDIKGFPATSLVLTCTGMVWAYLILMDSEQRHVLLLSFVFYSLYRTTFFTFFFAYLADVLGFRYFGMLAGIIFLLAGILGMAQLPLATYASGTCHILAADQAECSKGNWGFVNSVMVLMITCTLYFSYQDQARRNQQQKEEEREKELEEKEKEKLLLLATGAAAGHVAVVAVKGYGSVK
jgi:signal transduction histidine kinase